MDKQSTLEEYVLIAKDDYLDDAINQDLNESANNQTEFLLNNQQQVQSKDDQLVDYYLTGTNELNENNELHNDLENKNESNESQMYREQDLYLPITNISRIMKKRLPANGKLSKESKTQIQECVSEFISFITMEACEMVKMEKRKTLNGEDLINAMLALGFDNYIEPLRIYLKKYRQLTSTTFLNDSSSDLLNDNQ